MKIRPIRVLFELVPRIQNNSKIGLSNHVIAQTENGATDTEVKAKE
ncbi:MAG: hypothetical protein AB8G11_16260 [Saprospiraceae bacterium]